MKKEDSPRPVISTLMVEVKVLKIGRKQCTLAVFDQLPVLDITPEFWAENMEQIAIWGRVKRKERNSGYDYRWHLIFSYQRKLYKCLMIDKINLNLEGLLGEIILDVKGFNGLYYLPGNEPGMEWEEKQKYNKVRQELWLEGVGFYIAFIDGKYLSINDIIRPKFDDGFQPGDQPSKFVFRPSSNSGLYGQSTYENSYNWFAQFYPSFTEQMETILANKQAEYNGWNAFVDECKKADQLFIAV